MNRKLARRLPVVTAFAATSILAANIAFAAWSTNGSGSGSAAAGTSNALGVAVAFDSGLVPSTSKTVTVTLTNSNPYKVEVSSIALGTAGITSNVTSCNAGHGVTYQAPTIGDDVVVVPAKAGDTNGQTVVTLTDALSMSSSSADACKTATFTLPLAVTGESTDATVTPAVTLP